MRLNNFRLRKSLLDLCNSSNTPSPPTLRQQFQARAAKVIQRCNKAVLQAQKSLLKSTNARNTSGTAPSKRKASLIPQQRPPSIKRVSFNELPDRALVLVFRYLDVKSRVRLERVSRQWRDVGKGSWTHTRTLNLTELPASADGYFLNEKSVKPVFERCGEHLKELVCINKNHTPYSLNLGTLNVASSYCPNLVSLKLYTVDLLFSNKHKANATFTEYLYQFRKLEELVLDFCVLKSASSDLRIQIGAECLSRFPALRRVYINEVKLDGTSFIQICDVLAPRLQCLDLATIKPLPSRALVLGLSKLSSLRELALSNDQLNDDVLQTISVKCQNLQLLFCVEGTITASGLKTVVRGMTALKCLCLVSCFDYVNHLPSVKCGRPWGAEVVSVLINRQDGVGEREQVALNYYPEPVVSYELVDFRELTNEKFNNITKQFWILSTFLQLAS